ncbi:hypothetical protein [Sorangium cellulosum]|uniref:Uncharacterized protein n=1 Tax=Sorangium cellulosum TaxID=56 RepID=A0A150QGF4_SORCE|nr:hypothetical protein [Sorangium cellulosum]KYF67064.1 hypothetical protein BE15_25400 [Sorangium cellulosum]
MKSPKETRARLRPWVDPVWSAITPEARKEQLVRLTRAQARGALLLRIARGTEVRAELAKMAARTKALEATEREVSEAWVSVVLVEGAGERRRSRLGTVVFVLAVVCGAALAILRLRG